MKNTIGERIKSLRISLGMTQEELGEKIGVKKAAINKYETGRVINIKRDNVEKLANVLNTAPEYILGYTTTVKTATYTQENGTERVEIYLAPDSILLMLNGEQGSFNDLFFRMNTDNKETVLLSMIDYYCKEVSE